MQTSGVILDIYDDHRGRILREKTAAAPLPEKLKTAALLSPEELSRLPDRLFALVAQDGDQTLRKYAMHDEAHLATSVIYFLECGHLLPKVAQDVAAQNLVAACDWYDIDVPPPLLKMAGVASSALGVGGAALGVMGMVDGTKAGLEKKKSDMDRFRMAQASGMSVPPQHKTASLEEPSDDLEELLFGEKSAAEWSDMRKHTRREKRPGGDWEAVTYTPTKKEGTWEATRGGKTTLEHDSGWDKKADLTGTEIMTHQEVNRGKRVIHPSSKSSVATATTSKSAGIYPVDPHVDITGLAAPTVIKEAVYQHFALGDRYPIDSYGQVKQAEAYFDEHAHLFALPDRRNFAVSLVKRANDLGINVEGRALDYAGFRYGPHVMAELQKRANNFDDPAASEVFTDLQEKVASGMSPHIAVVAIAQADQALHLEPAYGRPVVGFRDPFAAVYGVKVAADQVTGLDDAARAEYPTEARSFSWNEGSDYVTEDMLYHIAESHLPSLDDMFGAGFGKDFGKDPVGTFKSLPDPQKHAIARLASDNSGGSFRNS